MICKTARDFYSELRKQRPCLNAIRRTLRRTSFGLKLKIKAESSKRSTENRDELNALSNLYPLQTQNI